MKSLRYRLAHTDFLQFNTKFGKGFSGYAVFETAFEQRKTTKVSTS